ncbi:unnamed protein product [Linum trigynum]|uniref:Two-component response regulator-like APRR5 n=1 Tax=Linum trigynum TaxID=586398 RepID=A0AAV2D5F5_9ROSI
MGELETSCSISSSRAAEEEMERGRGGGLLEKQSNRSGGNQEEVGTEEEEDTQSENQHRNQMSKRRRKKQQQQQMMNGENSMNEVDDGGGGGGESRSNNGLMVRWERLLPRMVLRVLLVESDDSTRQIIAALLRKCSYRVAAVSDGLKAWKLLKERPHNIDLLLTEVDLPSISGYALLTLMTEHEICKNIPVIMMSKEDSVSTVYKCMMRGAADYLVKPIRRNELRNLWQHVWRRQTQLSRENLPQDESVGQDRAEATSENNVNHSTGDVPCVQKNKDFVEKGSEAQSSCTKPGAEAGSSGKVQDFLQPVGAEQVLDDTSCQRHEACAGSNQRLLVHENQAQERTRTDANTEACDTDGANFHREGIDFMGAVTLDKSSQENMRSNFETYPDLDLSLKSTHSCELALQLSEERHSLRQSTTSAFTRYIARSLQTQHSTSACNQKELGIDPERNFSSVVVGNTSTSPTPASAGLDRTASQPISQAKDSEVGSSMPQQRVLFQVQTPPNDVRNSDSNPGFMFPPFISKQQSVPSQQLPSPCSASHQEPHLTTLQKQDHKQEDWRHVSSATDQSGSSSFCNGAVNHFNSSMYSSMGYGSTSGSMSNADQVGMVNGGAAADSQNVEGLFTHIPNSHHRSMLREAALNKFRLKRKERCFEKKVRYESRKKLAEQRPRVKGQFVRQAPVEAAPLEPE